MAEMVRDWPGYRALALSLGLPRVTEEAPWGHPCLKAHGRMWAWFSPYAEAAVIKASLDEREMLMAAAPETFFLHPHYRAHPYVLAHAGKLDPDWAKARLLADWRAMAPKRWLKDWDATSRAG